MHNYRTILLDTFSFLPISALTSFSKIPNKFFYTVLFIYFHLLFVFEYSRKLTALELTAFPEFPYFSSPPLFRGAYIFYIFIKKFPNSY